MNKFNKHISKTKSLLMIKSGWKKYIQYARDSKSFNCQIQEIFGSHKRVPSKTSLRL